MKYWKTLPFVLIHIIAECVFIRVKACSQEGEIQQDHGLQKVFDSSDVVIYGNVRFRHPPPLKWADYYTATMNVYCTLKGPTQGRLLNITDAGSIGGRCFEVVLDIGRDYIVFLTGRNSLTPAGEPVIAINKVLTDIASICTYTGGTLDPAITSPIRECPTKINKPECYTVEDHSTENPTEIIADKSNNIPYDHSNEVDNENTIDKEEKNDRVVAASHSSGSSAVKLTTLTLLIPLIFKLWIGDS